MVRRARSGIGSGLAWVLASGLVACAPAPSVTPPVTDAGVNQDPVTADAGVPDAGPTLSVDHVTSKANATNVLSWRLEADVVAAPFARAVVWGADGVEHASALVSVPAGGHVVVHAFALSPSTDYSAVVEAVGPASSARSAPVHFTTGALPAAVAGLSLSVTGTPPDDLLLVNLISTSSPAVVAMFDGAGTLRWYRTFDVAVPANMVKQLDSGNLLVFLGLTPGWVQAVGQYVELAPSGEQLRSFFAPAPSYTDDHDMLLTDEGTPNERAHLFSYEPRTMDLAAVGQPGPATIIGHSLVRLRPTGEPEFTWSAFDHLELSEWINPILPGTWANYDFDHPNSVVLDASGNYVVSFRNLDAILGIDAHTGDIRWRLGGTKSDFTFVNDPFGGPSGQHHVQLLPDGHLLLFDNGTLHSPPTTRAVEYALDFQAKTATLVWQYVAPPELFNQFVGAVTRDTDGDTWLGYGLRGVAQRVAADGTVLWQGTVQNQGTTVGFYRATPVKAIDRHQAP